MKTSKAHFRVFKKEIRRLAKLWKMDGWLIEASHAEIEADRFAEQCTHLEQRKCKLTLNKTWPENGGPITKTVLVDTARHEMVHCIVEPLSSLGWSRFATRPELAQAEHEVLRRLTLLLP
jgi:hypothetical protein